VAANNNANGANGPIFRLVSEFAAVEVGRDDRGNGPRLMIRDTQSGNRVFLDPLELAALATTRHEDLLSLLDPARFERRGPAPQDAHEPDD
jgi:hypothetical protein